MTTDAIECAFSGRIGQEPQVRTSKAGKPWQSFSAVVGSGVDAQWVQVAVFGDLAQELMGRLSKGTRVYVEGRIRINKWTGKDGTENAGLSVAASLVQPLGQIGQRKPTPQRAAQKPTTRPAAPVSDVADFDDTRDGLSYL